MEIVVQRHSQPLNSGHTLWYNQQDPKPKYKLLKKNKKNKTLSRMAQLDIVLLILTNQRKI